MMRVSVTRATRSCQSNDYQTSSIPSSAAQEIRSATSRTAAGRHSATRYVFSGVAACARASRERFLGSFWEILGFRKVFGFHSPTVLWWPAGRGPCRSGAGQRRRPAPWAGFENAHKTPATCCRGAKQRSRRKRVHHNYSGIVLFRRKRKKKKSDESFRMHLTEQDEDDSRRGGRREAQMPGSLSSASINRC